MRIKEIGIQGFKSFVDRTSLTLGSGISCVVGPNGCGKSNVIDAIKWVLGEQRARSLRGAAMSDVIFAGTETRAPVGLAEVTLTLTNEAGVFPGSWEPFGELEVTRKLYRNGDSDYLINRTPCRLKDIRDLFMDTGVGGRSSYAIIEQGRVEQLVSSRPEERRHIIEEAAGVSRYKARREEALRRLERTQQNLERVGDLVKELSRQLTSLERQAKKAELFLELRIEVRRGDLLQALVGLEQLEGERARVEVEQGQLEGRLALSRDQQTTQEQAVEALRQQVGEEGRRLGGLRDNLAKAENDVRLKEGSVALHERELEGLTRRLASFEADVDRYTKRLADAQEAAEASQKALDEVKERLEIAEADRAQREGGLKASSAEQKALAQRLEHGKQQLVRQLTEAARLHNHLANLSARTRELDTRVERNRHEAAQVEERMATASARLKELEDNHQAIAEKKAGIAEGMQARGAELALIDEEIKELQIRLDKRRAHLNVRQSRLQSLKELEQEYEGFGEGTRAILSRRERDDSGVVAVVADVVRVPRDLEVATEAALGERLQWVIVDTPESGGGNVRWLKSREAGRGAFIPLTASPQLQGVKPKGGAVIGPLMAHLSFDDAFLSVVQALLGDVFLVEDLAAALQSWEASGRSGTFVSKGGDVVSASGVVIGGSGGGVGVLRKKGEIRELSEEVAELAERLEADEGVLEDRRLRRLDVVEGFDALRIQLHETELELVRMERDLTGARAEAERHQKQLRLIELDGKQLDVQQKELATEEIKSRERAAEVEAAKVAQESELGQLSKDLSRVQRAQEEAQEALTQLRVRVAEAASQKEEAQRAVTRHRAECVEFDKTIKLRRNEITEAATHEARIRKEAGEAGAEVVRLGRVIDELSKEIERSSSGYGQARQQLSAAEDALASTRRLVGETERALAALGVRVAELRLKIDHVCEGVTERHELDLWQIRQEVAEPGSVAEPDPPRGPVEEVQVNLFGDDEAESEEAPKTPTLEAHLRVSIRAEGSALRAALAELEAMDDSARAEHWRRLQIKLEQGRKRLSRLGGINLEAIDSFHEVKERHDFTVAQQTDLQSSVDDIKKTILKINRTSRERFRTAFKAIDAHFQAIFPKIFEGGSARLELTDPENLLESGVDIAVQPPGKKVQNMNLLSGGEKAMTAVALIFALFRVRPSPFCILDEVDAPLDEANSHRFHEVVKELSEVSQFIVITHNKKTMEVADTLYGVTMEEPGVSRLVSVDLS